MKKKDKVNVDEIDEIDQIDESSNELLNEYDLYHNKGSYLILQIKEQITKVFIEKKISLGVPLESRVKSKDSIKEKLTRKKIKLNSINELDDFLGLRIILLFQKDLVEVTKCIEENFLIIEKDDKNKTDEAEEFGYKSIHYLVKTTEGWNKLPTLSDGSLFNIEIQVRTLSQHIWAAASHKLQYKVEGNIPIPLRRNIHRISAILELVDLEFDRVLQERELYIKDFIEKTNALDSNNLANINLDIEVLKVISKNHLPQDNLAEEKAYSLLLNELSLNKLNAENLIEIIKNNLEKTRERDLLLAKKNINRAEIENRQIKEIWHKGRYLTDVGLIRSCIRSHFENIGQEYLMAKN